MGLQLPSRAVAPVKRVATATVLGLTLLLLGACSAEDKDQIANLAMPSPITEQGPATFDLWRWAWVAAMAVGVLTWGLIFYAAWRFRRRRADEVPVQVRYNLPLEIFYTIAPIMMVVVFFYWTVDVQNKVTELVDDPDVTVDVVGQQWSWTFNYTEQGEDGTTPYTVGTTDLLPTLVLPVDQRVQFNLHSPDVIHSFGVPAFLTKLDVIPGRVNKFQVTPNEIGTYAGKCFELCGTYHSRMLFNVEVVSQADYDAYLADLEAEGSVADAPLLGGSDALTQAGLDDPSKDEVEEAGLAEDDDEEGDQE
ncbi:aa3-type cytochrome oxidase subunit II [Nocardioides campestrisoli]|uniref:aa3-type cytochrome oxidase subunit II n=1 Tax=Nocardioides campestrisoli TaxID=2736757 RepID=UPI001CD34F07|nr:cytochrome c oxidase subunit II [Nocardioides campestrisoli]